MTKHEHFCTADSPLFHLQPNTMAFAASQKLNLRPAGVRGGRRSLVVKATSRVDAYSKNDIIVSPSILSANFSKLGDEVRPLAAGRT